MLLSLLAPLLLTAAHASPALDSLSLQAPAGAPPPPAVSAPGLREWTVMVYMNGKSNIEPYALSDMNRFETVGSDGKVAIVAEIGRSRGLENDTTADGDWTGVRRYYVTKDTDPAHIASPMLADLGNVDMGDWRQAAAFLKWARAEYPAKKYLFVIWDHGWGWIDPKSFGGGHGAGRQRSISHDFTTGHYISTLDLGKIFEEGGKVDMYVSMACFMQMAEVADQLRDAARVIVGSEEVIQLPSLNWEGFLGGLEADPAMGPERAGALMADAFHEMYSRPQYQQLLADGKYGTQLSAIRADRVRGLADRARDWYTLAMKDDDREAMAKAKAEVLRFEVGDEKTDPDKRISFYGDLYDLTELFGRYADRTRPGAAEALAAGRALEKYISDELVIRTVWVGKDRTGKEYSRTHGISVDIPGKPGDLIDYYPTYSRLRFARDSGWETFMNYLEGIPDR